MSRIIRVTNVTFVTNVMQTLELVFGYEKVVPANPTATLASSNNPNVPHNSQLICFPRPRNSP
jgi:hypothetical protein